MPGSRARSDDSEDERQDEQQEDERGERHSPCDGEDHEDQDEKPEHGTSSSCGSSCRKYRLPAYPCSVRTKRSKGDDAPWRSSTLAPGNPGESTRTRR